MSNNNTTNNDDRVLAGGSDDSQGWFLDVDGRLSWSREAGPVIAPEAEFEDLRRWLRLVHEVRQGGELLLAEMIGVARERGWLERLEREMEQMEFDRMTIVRSLCIAEVPKGMRSPKLTAEHYFLLGRANLSREEMARWARDAVRYGLDAFELKKSMEAGQVLRREDISDRSGYGSGGIINYQGILTKWLRWEQKVGGEDAILAWPRPVLEAWVDAWRPMRVVLERAERRLRQVMNETDRANKTDGADGGSQGRAE